ncbi:MAG: hypothetical protein PHQ98_03415 [Candidatus ainarchaeum sp.]|nr:hypothetical protein [Candidatus ainarchaeum sp.]
MNYKIEIIIPLMLILTIFLPYAHADNIFIDLAGVIGAVNNNTNNTTQNMTNSTNLIDQTLNTIPTQIFDHFKTQTKNSIIQFNNSLLELTIILISTNPDPNRMMPLWQIIIAIISSLYLIIFLITGLKFLTVGTNITKREEAKESLKNNILMIIAINLSFLIYQLILELSTAITFFIFTNQSQYILTQTSQSGIGLILLIANSGAITSTLITLFIRYLFLLLSVPIFPIGILFYLIPSLKGWGKMIFNLIGIILSIQIIDIILLITITHAITSLGTSSSTDLIIPIGFIIIAITNTIIILYAILKSIFTMMDNSKMLSMTINTLINVATKIAIAGA